MKQVTVAAPVNIALIKYWGKRDADKMLPLNDSLSVSLNRLQAATTVTVLQPVDCIHEDVVILNGQRIALEDYPRFGRVFDIVRTLQNTSNAVDTIYFKVESMTNFPTEAGLASSAAGFAALAFAFGRLFKLQEDKVIELARFGSGSACRGIQSGFIHWKAGIRGDGADCLCQQIFPSNHWPELRAVIIITSNEKKPTSSTRGMQRSVETSEMLKYRVNQVVPERIRDLIEAIQWRDFATFGDIVMRDSDQLHDICGDTVPPIQYMTKASWHLIAIVGELNRICKETKFAYTFDAGPNCCVFTMEKNVPYLIAHLLKYLPASLNNDQSPKMMIDKNVLHSIELIQCEQLVNIEELVYDAIKSIIVSEIGGPPLVMNV